MDDILENSESLFFLFFVQNNLSLFGVVIASTTIAHFSAIDIRNVNVRLKLKLFFSWFFMPVLHEFNCIIFCDIYELNSVLKWKCEKVQQFLYSLKCIQNFWSHSKNYTDFINHITQRIFLKLAVAKLFYYFLPTWNLYVWELFYTFVNCNSIREKEIRMYRNGILIKNTFGELF